MEPKLLPVKMLTRIFGRELGIPSIEMRSTAKYKMPSEFKSKTCRTC